MSTRPPVGIVVVNYRSAQLVCDLLGSIAQRGRGWVERVVVVDNASADSSADVLRSRVQSLDVSEWIFVAESPRNAGFGAGNNFGVEALRGLGPLPDILWFLNPDTLVGNLDLSPALDWFHRDPRVAIVGTGLDDGRGGVDVGAHREKRPLGEFVNSGGGVRWARRFASSDPSLERPGPADWVSGASFLMRSDVFERLGGFDEGFFLYFEEVDLCRRVRDAGYAVVYEPATRVVHLEGQTTGVRGTKRRPRYWYESRRRYFVKHFGISGLVLADLAWAVGRTIGALRRRPPNPCTLGDILRCDAPAVLGKQRTAGEPCPR